MQPANDNRPRLVCNLDHAVPGQALHVRQPRSKFGRSYAEFVGHAGDGKHVIVRKLISSMWKARWSWPLKVKRADVLKVHDIMARAA